MALATISFPVMEMQSRRESFALGDDARGRIRYPVQSSKIRLIGLGVNGPIKQAGIP